AGRAALPAEDDVMYLPRADLLERLALGHHELLADLVFIRAVNYFGAQLTSEGRRYQWLDRHLDTANRPDPRFRPPSPFGPATILTEEGSAEAALRYLEEAYLTTDSEASREAIGNLLAAKQRSLYGKLTRARDEFVARWKQRMPYAPGDLYVLVGDPPSPRM